MIAVDNSNSNNNDNNNNDNPKKENNNDNSTTRISQKVAQAKALDEVLASTREGVVGVAVLFLFCCCFVAVVGVVGVACVAVVLL